MRGAQGRMFVDVGTERDADPMRLVWMRVVACCAALWEVSPTQLRGPVKTRRLSVARRHAWFVMRDEHDLTYPELARLVGRGGDHSTVMLQVKKFARECGLPDWRHV